MRRLLLMLSALLLAGGIAQAQTRSAPRPPPHKPYGLVAVHLLPPADDASFILFREQLAAIVKRRVFAELAAVVSAREFFWDRDFRRGFDPSKPGVENLAFAIGLEARGGAGWKRLAGFAAEPTAMPIPSRVGVICGPPDPAYDEAELDRLVEATKTQGQAWIYPRTADVAVRAAPRAGSALVETLGLYFVHVLGYEASDTDAEPERTAWARVATPTGKAGFVAPGMLRPLSVDQLCYVKDVIGRWRITGYIGRGD